jgi:hypothetical protein
MPVFLQGVAQVYIRAGAGHISLRDMRAPELEFKENGAMVFALSRSGGRGKMWTGSRATTQKNIFLPRPG